MNTTPHDAAGNEPAVPIELGPIAEKVGRALRGQVAQERIEQVLNTLLARDFSDARVTTYLPIFLQRAACESLQAEAQHPGSRH